MSLMQRPSHGNAADTGPADSQRSGPDAALSPTTLFNVDSVRIQLWRRASDRTGVDRLSTRSGSLYLCAADGQGPVSRFGASLIGLYLVCSTRLPIIVVYSAACSRLRSSDVTFTLRTVNARRCRGRCIAACIAADRAMDNSYVASISVCMRRSYNQEPVIVLKVLRLYLDSEIVKQLTTLQIHTIDNSPS